MKKIISVIGCILRITFLQAQDTTVQSLLNESKREIKKDAKDTMPATWKTGGLYSITFNQGALNNWSAGGDKFSLSLSSFLNVFALYKKDRHSWDNILDLAYGMVSTTSLGQRKSDDRIDLLSKYGYQVSKKWYISGLFNFRTQFAPGYSYPDNSQKVLTSSFLSPAYIILSPGIDYKPNDHFSVFLSPVTSRWVIVEDEVLSAAGAFGVEPGRTLKMEFGAFASLNYFKSTSANATYKTKLDLFSNYKHEPQNVDIFWANILAVKVSRIITMNLSVDVLYDNDTKTVKDTGVIGGAAPQIKELWA